MDKLSNCLLNDCICVCKSALLSAFPRVLGFENPGLIHHKKTGFEQTKILFRKTDITEAVGFGLPIASSSQGQQPVLKGKPQRDSWRVPASHNIIRDEAVGDFPRWHSFSLSGSFVLWWFGPLWANQSERGGTFTVCWFTTVRGVWRAAA